MTVEPPERPARGPTGAEGPVAEGRQAAPDRPGGALPVSVDVSAVPAHPAGAGRYTIDLVAALIPRPEVALTLVSRRDDVARWEDLGTRSVVGAAPGIRPLRLAWEQVRLPAILERVGVDVHHGPHYTMPERSRVPVVVTIHDLTFFDHPEWHERSKVRFFRRAIRVAARRAAALICVSETTADRLHALCDVRAPVYVAPHGVDSHRFSPDEPSPGADAAVLRRLGLDPGRPYVVFVGTVEPRKNVPALVAAFGRIAAGHPDVRLVLAGQPGWGARAMQEAVTALGPAADRVVRTGYVPDEGVPALLRAAAVVAYPSLQEGYGLPALEALACGAPLVTTRGTAMAEIAADAAVLVPPGDVEALSEALDTMLSAGPEDPACLNRRYHGLAIARGRTWEASAVEHIRAYRMAAGE